MELNSRMHLQVRVVSCDQSYLTSMFTFTNETLVGRILFSSFHSFELIHCHRWFGLVARIAYRSPTRVCKNRDIRRCTGYLRRKYLLMITIMTERIYFIREKIWKNAPWHSRRTARGVNRWAVATQSTQHFSHFHAPHTHTSRMILTIYRPASITTCFHSLFPLWHLWIKNCL